MRVLRFHISKMMAVVAIAALGFAVICSPFAWIGFFFLLLGTLPMALILALGNRIGRRYPGSGPFLRGFETFGRMAMALFAASLVVGPLIDEHWRPWDWYLERIDHQIIKDGDGDNPVVVIPVFCLAVAMMLCLPQLLFALLGGFLSWMFRLTKTKAAHSSLNSESSLG